MMWIVAVVVAIIVLSRSGILSRLKQPAASSQATPLDIEPGSIIRVPKVRQADLSQSLTDLVREHQYRRREVEAEEKMLREFLDHGKESPE